MLRRHVPLFGAIFLALAFCASVRAQGPIFAAPVVLDSFETSTGGIARWHTLDPVDQIYIQHAQSTIGATHGANSMLLELEGDHGQFGEWGAIGGWAVQGDFTPGDAALYTAWQTAAANPAAWNLQFDVTTTADSWTNAPPVSDDPFASGPSASLLRVGFSYQDDSLNPGFGQVSGQNLYQVVGKNTVSVPLSSLQQAGVPIGSASGYYSVLIGADNRFIRDPAGGAKYYIDRVRLKPAPPQVPVTLFSWESTPTFLEHGTLGGWTDAGLNAPSATSPGDAYAHHDTISNYSVPNPNGPGNVFPTHGSQGLKIDTTWQDPAHPNPLGLAQSYGFRWATSYILNTEEPPAGLDATQTQAKIAFLADKINKGDFLQFDLVVSDPIGEGTGDFQGGSTASLPGFLGIEVSIHDNRGTFFQAGNPKVFNGAEIQAMVLNNPDALEPFKVSIPLSAFTNVSGDAESRATFPTLKSAPLPLDLTELRMNIALNFNNGPVVAHIDNFRILTPIALDADFDHNGKVDSADLTIWKNNRGLNPNGDADEDGDTDGNDFLIWQRQLGNNGQGGSLGSVAAVGAVPEPTSAILLAMAALAIGRVRLRR
jgi:hypothetical protein